MSSGSGSSTSSTVSTASASTAGGGVPPATPAATSLSPAVVSLLGSLVRNIVRSEMASAHSPTGSVPAVSDWVQFCPGGNVAHYSRWDHVRYALLPCVSLVRPPTPSIEFLPFVQLVGLVYKIKQIK